MGNRASGLMLMTRNPWYGLLGLPWLGRNASEILSFAPAPHSNPGALSFPNWGEILR